MNAHASQRQNRSFPQEGYCLSIFLHQTRLQILLHWRTSRSLCERVKEHSKEGSNSAMYQHCTTKGHPLPNIGQFKVIDQEKSQIACETKEAIHIHKVDPELNRNIGKMVIPHVLDPILGIKPKIHAFLH